VPVPPPAPRRAALPPPPPPDGSGDPPLLYPHPRHYDNTSPEVANGGWRWGGRGGVTSAAIEKPHFSAWRPILQTGFDLAYSPLLELPVGEGRLLLSTLDLHDHARQDPAAEVPLKRGLAQLATPQVALSTERPARALVDPTWRQRLAQLGIAAPDGLEDLAAQTVLLIGRELAPAELTAVTAHVEAGGRALILPGAAIPTAWDLRREAVALQPGSLEPPRLEALRGLDVSDLRIRAAHPGWILSGTGEIDAGGQYAEQAVGAGRIAVIGFDPWQYDTAAHPYLRFTVWRQARALAQVLANHGLRPDHDRRIFRAPQTSVRLSLAGTWQAYPTALLPGTGKPATDPGPSAAAQAIIAGTGAPQGADQVELPAAWEGFAGAWRDANGEAVFEREVEIPAAWQGQPLLLSLGVLDDVDRVAIDGREIGRTDEQTPRWWTVPRRYEVPAELVQAGRMRITVRIFDHAGGGGFMARSAEDLFLIPRSELAAEAAAETQPGPYHPDYRADFATGDDPYRYYNW
jgi:hypothetical protein